MWASRIWEAHKRFRRVKYCIDRAGGGERAIGVSRDSYLKFIARRSGRAIQNAGRLTGKKYDTIFASYR